MNGSFLHGGVNGIRIGRMSHYPKAHGRQGIDTEKLGEMNSQSKPMWISCIFDDLLVIFECFHIYIYIWNFAFRQIEFGFCLSSFGKILSKIVKIGKSLGATIGKEHPK
jgi:hypothetical protein